MSISLGCGGGGSDGGGSGRRSLRRSRRSSGDRAGLATTGGAFQDATFRRAGRRRSTTLPTPSTSSPPGRCREAPVRRTEREASTSSSESESSDGGIDDGSLLERMAAAARRGARRVALRNAIGHRATRRVERHGGLPLATIQQRWDLAMTMPTAGADGVRASDDDSTRTRATRGGDVAQGHATAGHEGVQPVADKATEHARPTDAVARRAVRFGEGNAEGRGSGSGRLASRLPAGAKQKEAAHGGAPPTTRSRDERSASGRLPTRRSTAHQALSGGEPGGPASVLGRYAPGETGSRLRDGGTSVLGCPTGETVGNQKQERRTASRPSVKQCSTMLGAVGFRAQSCAAGQTVRDRRRGARERRRPATDGTSADVTSAQGGRLCQVGDPGCGGSKGRRGCGLGDGRLAGGAPPTEVGSAHSADGRGGEAGGTTAVCGEDAGGVWCCCERVHGRLRD